MKFANGVLKTKSLANPTFWNACPLKVATNSSETPEATGVVPPIRAPSTVTAPLATETVPVPLPPSAGDHCAPCHPDGSADPENSAPAAGDSMISPFVVSET